MWTLAGGQWRASGFGVIALDWPAVAECATWLDIDVRLPRVLAGLQTLERATLDEQRKRFEAEKK